MMREERTEGFKTELEEEIAEVKHRRLESGREELNLEYKFKYENDVTLSPLAINQMEVDCVKKALAWASEMIKHRNYTVEQETLNPFEGLGFLNDYTVYTTTVRIKVLTEFRYIEPRFETIS